jgi:hypothetical protein
MVQCDSKLVRARTGVSVPPITENTKLSKSIRLSSRERTILLVMNTLTDCETRVYWPLVWDRRAPVLLISEHVEVIITNEWPAYPDAMRRTGVTRHKTIQHKKRIYR